MDESKDRILLIEDTKRMHEAIANAVLTWAHLENSLAVLLSVLIDGKNGGTNIGNAIYFSPSNTETRIKIVCAVFEQTKPIIFADQIQACFDKIINKINKSKESRNNIVHGNVVTVQMNGKNRIRLTGPIFQVVTRKTSRVRRGTIPGMSSADVEQAVKAIGDRIGDLGLLTQTINEIRDARLDDTSLPKTDYVSRRQALHKKVLTLEGHLNISTLD